MTKLKLYAIRYTLYAMLLCAIVAHTSFADTIYIEDGSIMKGLVVEEHYDRVILSMPDGEATVFKKDIDEIFFDALEQNYCYLANRFLSEGDFERAEKFYIKALGISPDYDYKSARDGLSRLNDIKTKEIKKWKASRPLQTLRDQVGISILKVDDFCRVNKVFKKDMGLNIEDEITAVWDESTKFMEEGGVAERIIGVPNTPVKITIHRKINFCSACLPWYLRIWGLKEKEILPLRMELEGLTVGRVKRGSSAVRAGLAYGDRIIAIDGKSTRYMSLEEADSLMHTKAPKGVELTIQRDIELNRAER